MVNQRIRNYIKTNGLLINHIADKANISRKKMYRLLDGKSKMTVEDYEKICIQGLGLSPGFFLNKNS